MRAWERVKFVMENEGHNKNSFSKAIGMSNNVTITLIINKKRKPHPATLEKIAQKFPKYNPEWLFEGDGEIYNYPYIQENTEKTNPEIENVSERNLFTNIIEKNANKNPHFDTSLPENVGFMEVPLIHVPAQRGYVTGYANEEFIQTLPTLPVMADRAYRGKYRLFEVKGDSMDNDTRRSICDGDIVLAREIQRYLWPHKLGNNDWYFVIVHPTDGISIKQITGHNAEQGIVTCHSLNDMFDDYTMRLDDVAELYHIVKIVDRSMGL